MGEYYNRTDFVRRVTSWMCGKTDGRWMWFDKEHSGNSQNFSNMFWVDEKAQIGLIVYGAPSSAFDNVWTYHLYDVKGNKLRESYQLPITLSVDGYITGIRGLNDSQAMLTMTTGKRYLIDKDEILYEYPHRSIGSAYFTENGDVHYLLGDQITVDYADGSETLEITLPEHQGSSWVHYGVATQAESMYAASRTRMVYFNGFWWIMTQAIPLVHEIADGVWEQIDPDEENDTALICTTERTVLGRLKLEGGIIECMTVAFGYIYCVIREQFTTNYSFARISVGGIGGDGDPILDFKIPLVWEGDGYVVGQPVVCAGDDKVVVSFNYITEEHDGPFVPSPEDPGHPDAYAKRMFVFEIDGTLVMKKGTPQGDDCTAYPAGGFIWHSYVDTKDDGPDWVDNLYASVLDTFDYDGELVFKRRYNGEMLRQVQCRGDYFMMSGILAFIAANTSGDEKRYEEE